jgi:hypothetical protein
MHGFKQGDTVTILKGTVIKTTHPQFPEKCAKRTYKIKINHVLRGWSICVGARHFDAKGNMEHEGWQGVHRSDEHHVRGVLGGPITNEALRAHCHEGERYKRPDGSSYCHLLIRITPPSFRWAGTGGYWHEVAVTDLPMPV